MKYMMKRLINIYCTDLGSSPHLMNTSDIIPPSQLDGPQLYNRYEFTIFCELIIL